MIYFIIGLFLLVIIEYYLFKDIKKILKIESIILIVSGYLVIVFNYFLKILINKKISFINISNITNYVFIKCINRGLLLILIGGIMLIIYGIFIIYKRYRENSVK